MPDGIDDAAQAFDADIASETSSPKGPGPKVDRTEGPPERLFGDVGDLEVDEDSPAKAPGDDYEDSPPRTKEDEEEEGEEEEGPDDDDEVEEDDPEEKAFYAQEVPVMIDGEAKNVTLKEALEGYVRTQTFHKRMNEVEEAKKTIRSTASDVIQNFQYSANLAREIEAHLEALVPPEPNWDEEFKKNPARAREVQKYYDQVRGFKGALRQRINEAQQKQAESNSVQLKAYAQEEAKKFDQANTKNWSTDPKKKTKDLQAMRRTALTHGFSEEEISQVYDSRMLNVLLKASRYDRMMASKPKPVSNRQATAKPVPTGSGPARSRPAQKGYSSAMNRLNRTGHIEDAALVFDHILASEKRR
jgi:hypothetical protein